MIVFGWPPPFFGLDWWASVSSVVAGTVFTAPLALVSLRTGTNLSTSSGARFGVRGRLVGSVVGLLLTLGYTVLTVWTGGDVMMGVLDRLSGLPQGGAAYAVVYGLLAAATVAGAVYGYRVLLALSRVLAFGMTALGPRTDRLRPRLHDRRAARGGRTSAGRVLADVAARRRGRRSVRTDRLHHAARRLHPLHPPRPASPPAGSCTRAGWT